MATITKIVAVLLAATALVSAAPALLTKRQAGACTQKSVRKAWHTFTNEEKKAYLDAELCLMATPSTMGREGVLTKFDELQGIHHAQAYIIHNVGAFLPFHRMFVHTHEMSMRKECGYKGDIPYWDETHDSGKFTTSDILDPVVGFGGNGVGTDRCIQDGPFANYTSHLGPGYRITAHCITRNVNDRMSTGGSAQNIARCMDMIDFLTFWVCVEGMPHGAGHAGISGLMVDPISSPGDPLFFLHHVWIDYIWAKWQAQDPETRTNVIEGPNKPRPGAFGAFPIPGGGGAAGTTETPALPGGAGGIPGAGGFPGAGGTGTGTGAGTPGGATVPGGFGGFGGFGGAFDPSAMTPPKELMDAPVAGDAGNETTMSHVLNMLGVVPNATIADVVDIAGGILCYEYLDAES